jgi:hypothetical protein
MIVAGSEKTSKLCFFLNVFVAEKGQDRKIPSLWKRRGDHRSLTSCVQFGIY